MTSLTNTASSHRTSRRHLAVESAIAFGSWAVTAAAVIVANREFAPISLAACVAAKILVIVAGGFVYMRLSRDCTLDHALLVGAAWLLLGIATEVAVSKVTGHFWFALLGSPASAVTRDALLFAWVAAPALFARHE